MPDIESVELKYPREWSISRLCKKSSLHSKIGTIICFYARNDARWYLIPIDISENQLNIHVSDELNHTYRES